LLYWTNRTYWTYWNVRRKGTNRIYWNARRKGIYRTYWDARRKGTNRSSRARWYSI